MPLDMIQIPFLLTTVFLSACGNNNKNVSDLKLWYDRPAKRGEEALPLGNGRLGAIVLIQRNVNDCS